MLDHFSATIEKIYAAAGDSSLWVEALRAIEDYTGSTGAVLNLVPKHDSAMPLCLAGSFSEEDCAEYAANYMWRCPRIAFAQDHPDVPVHWDSLILSEREMDRDATYAWYGKHGLRYYIAGWAGQSSNHRAYMSLQRSRRQGHIEPEQIEQFKLMVTHVEQALMLAVKLGTFEQQSAFGLQMLEFLPNAVFGLDGQGRLLLANKRAQHLLDDGDGLVSFDGRLQFRLNSQQRRFDELLTSALDRDSIGVQGGWVQVPRASGRRPYVAMVTRCPMSQGFLTTCPPVVLVVIADPDSPSGPGTKVLQDIYGLTDAEARLANALSAGHSIESASASLGIQSATARSELKSVFKKLGLNRQQDLVRLLTSLSSMNL
ncbi:MAG TPA: helix-turn-helix transcriptional regulator [Sphingomicrobium sp.]|nr:helix-turn-helix transcriptional regulator [Sphingomicrobium sp.]